MRERQYFKLHNLKVKSTSEKQINDTCVYILYDNAKNEVSLKQLQKQHPCVYRDLYSGTIYTKDHPEDCKFPGTDPILCNLNDFLASSLLNEQIGIYTNDINFVNSNYIFTEEILSKLLEKEIAIESRDLFTRETMETCIKNRSIRNTPLLEVIIFCTHNLKKVNYANN